MPENFIPAIHNYCDRWCERCIFVSRCAIGASEKLEDLELKMNIAETEKEEDQLMVDYMMDSLQVVGSMLEKIAEDQGLDLTEIMEDLENKPYIPPEPNPAQQQLETWAKNYPLAVEQWFKDLQPDLNIDALYSKLLAHISNPELYTEQIKEAFSVIQWFMWFLAPKVHRAVSGKLEETWEKDLLQSDWNGSAKIALIAIDRSLNAWTSLRGFFPDQEDAMLDSLAILEKLKKGLKKEFPNAHQFIRPGFDEPRHYQTFK